MCVCGGGGWGGSSYYFHSIHTHIYVFSSKCTRSQTSGIPLSTVAAHVFTLQVSFLTLTGGVGAGALLFKLYSLSGGGGKGPIGRKVASVVKAHKVAVCEGQKMGDWVGLIRNSVFILINAEAFQNL